MNRYELGYKKQDSSVAIEKKRLKDEQDRKEEHSTKMALELKKLETTNPEEYKRIWNAICDTMDGKPNHADISDLFPGYRWKDFDYLCRLVYSLSEISPRLDLDNDKEFRTFCDAKDMLGLAYYYLDRKKHLNKAQWNFIMYQLQQSAQGEDREDMPESLDEFSQVDFSILVQTMEKLILVKQDAHIQYQQSVRNAKKEKLDRKKGEST